MPQLEQLPGDLFGQAETAGSVFAVGNDQIDHVAVNQPVQLTGNGLTSSFADYIADKQEFNGHTLSLLFHELHSP